MFLNYYQPNNNIVGEIYRTKNLERKREPVDAESRPKPIAIANASDNKQTTTETVGIFSLAPDILSL